MNHGLVEILEELRTPAVSFYEPESQGHSASQQEARCGLKAQPRLYGLLFFHRLSHDGNHNSQGDSAGRT